ncbi:MAG: hypothetical protein RIB93_18780 [Coleofasciculus sp. D1-CHI-01]
MSRENTANEGNRRHNTARDRGAEGTGGVGAGFTDNMQALNR